LFILEISYPKIIINRHFIHTNSFNNTWMY